MFNLVHESCQSLCYRALGSVDWYHILEGSEIMIHMDHESLKVVQGIFCSKKFTFLRGIVLFRWIKFFGFISKGVQSFLSIRVLEILLKNSTHSALRRVKIQDKWFFQVRIL